MPVDVEESGERRLRAVFEDVHPPRVLGAGGHVVGNNVEKKSHAAILKFRLQLVEFLFAADFGIDAARIDHVVSVRAALAGSEDWRQIQIRDAEFLKIIEDLQRVGKTEVLVE